MNVPDRILIPNGKTAHAAEAPPVYRWWHSPGLVWSWRVGMLVMAGTGAFFAWRAGNSAETAQEHIVRVIVALHQEEAQWRTTKAAPTEASPSPPPLPDRR